MEQVSDSQIKNGPGVAFGFACFLSHVAGSSTARRLWPHLTYTNDKWIAWAVGGVIMACGFALYFRSIQSAFASRKKGQLLTTGEYSWCRHPGYAAILFVFLPGLTIFRNQPGALLSVALGWILARSIVYVEEKRLIETFGDAYIEYQQGTPCLVPYRILAKDRGH